MRLLYAERRAVTQRVFQEVLGDRIRIDLRPGGLHMLAQLADHEDDVMIAEKARELGLATHALSRWYINAKSQQGLLLGFANVIDEKDARRIALKLKQAME
jgi:GntR family transcriptional regulator/MocR family aminotransferase